MRYVMGLLLTCLAVLPSPPARASSPIAEVLCAPTPQMRTRLSEQYRSAVTATGLRSPEEVMEVWTDPEGDWTMVIRYASGQSCIVAMGDAWQDAADRAPS